MQPYAMCVLEYIRQSSVPVDLCRMTRVTGIRWPTQLGQMQNAMHIEGQGTLTYLLSIIFSIWLQDTKGSNKHHGSSVCIFTFVLVLSHSNHTTAPWLELTKTIKVSLNLPGYLGLGSDSVSVSRASAFSVDRFQGVIAVSVVFFFFFLEQAGIMTRWGIWDTTEETGYHFTSASNE